MSDKQEADHTWFQEKIAAALANGLDPADQQRFESHAAECPACAAELQSLQQMEQRMTTLFAHPAANLEDRIISSLRESRPVLGSFIPKIRIHPHIQKAATGIAAAIVLAGFGYLAEQRITNDESRFASVAHTINVEIDDLLPTQRSPAHTFRSALRGETRNPNPDSGRPTSDYGLSAPRPMRYSYEDPQVGTTAAGDGRKFNNGSRKETPAAEGTVSRDNRFAANDAVQLPSDENTWSDASIKKPASAAPAAAPVVAGGTLTLSQPAKRAAVADNHSAINAPDGKKFYFETADADGDGAAAGKRIATAHGLGNEFFKPAQLGDRITTSGSTVVAGGGEVALVPQMQAAPEASVQPPAKQPVEGAGFPLQAAPSVQAGDVGGFAFAQGQTTPAPAAPATPPSGPPPAPPQHDAATAPMTQKVIRNGQIEFEVDRFDSAFATVSKLTTESSGYVGTSDSEKLPNGKVKGTVTVRVPPDRLDTLLLQLRGIGDLKSQKLDANDVSKHYTDLESELRADRAMEERLLGIIKDGKGQIKDLLAAEKELGNWREKIENIVGEMRYLDSQVAMSTLVITLYERDIKTPATAQETENVEAGMEATDVEKARADALKAIEDAKGRVIQSDLKRYDAGQFGATIVAEVPPDTAGPMLDRLKQIGKIARLDIQRKQTTDASADATAPQKVQKKDTHLNLSIYNLANVAPRITTTMNLAADDVEKTYATIRERIIKAGGRLIASDLARNKSDKTTGTISFDVPSSEADAVLNDLRAMGEVMHLTVTDNPDVNNVTTAKRGYVLQLVASAAIAPRETTTLQIAATKVAEARGKILTAASSGAARILISQLNETDPTNPNATIEIDVPRTNLATVEKTINDSGDTVSRNVSRSSDTENTLDTKVKLQISILPADKLPPRETTALTIETTDVEAAVANLQQSATQSNGKVLESNESKDQSGSTRATLVLELPQEKSPALVDQAKQAGTVRAAQSSRNLQLPASALAKSRLELTLVTPDTIVQPGTGPLATIRNGLSTSIKALLWSLELIVIGLCTVLPFALVVWAGWKLIKRKKSMPAPAQ